MSTAGDRNKAADKAEARLSRDEVLRTLDARGAELREELAARHDCEPEILHFIAREGTAAARRAVAANPSTPAEANRLLADDVDFGVRSELARKIARLLPGLSAEASQKVRALTLETLQHLAEDELPRVREILAEEVKSLSCVPKDVVDRLARDIESVSAPILEYSPLLSDSDLIDIITTAQARHALNAIAKRQPLSASVSDAIASAMDTPAVASLLGNASAQIRQKTLDKIVERAAQFREWHEPLVMREGLSRRAIRRIAGFVSASLIERLTARHGLDEETRTHLRRKLQDRLDADHRVGGVAAAVAARYRTGTLDDDFVAAAAQEGQRDVVVESLALLAALPAGAVQRVLDTRSAKPATALVWRAGLSMRVAFRIQTSLLRLQAADLLPARDGIHFPLSEDEMRWHLSYFNLGD